RTIGELCRLAPDDLVDRQSWMSADEVRDRRFRADATIREVRERLAAVGLALRGDRAAEFAGQPPECLGLSPRAASLVRFLRVSAVGELLALSSEDLFARTFRPVAVSELYRALAAHGLRLRDGYPRGPEDWGGQEAEPV